MAREEQDREDLLREAIALVERVELSIPACSEHVVAGFRRDGCASLYFGSDPAYHFNTARELRRAFVGGVLYKAERGKLVSLRRERTAYEVQLVRHELSDAETRELLAALKLQTNQLRESLISGDQRVIGQVPRDADVKGRLQQWLVELGDQGENIVVAANARVG